MSETIICAKLQFAVRQLSKLPMHNLKVTLHFEVYIMKLQNSYYPEERECVVEIALFSN